MSHLRNIVPFEPQGAMRDAVERIRHELDEATMAIDTVAPRNAYSEVAKILIEVAGHYADASFSAYATGTPNFAASVQGAAALTNTMKL